MKKKKIEKRKTESKHLVIILHVLRQSENKLGEKKKKNERVSRMHYIYLKIDEIIHDGWKENIIYVRDLKSTLKL